jgi:FlaA1/EpsC-like NDP-sugar epimerase
LAPVRGVGLRAGLGTPAQAASGGREAESEAAASEATAAAGFFAGKRVIVTGAAGSVGSELVRWLLQSRAAEVRGVDSNENALFLLEEELRADGRFNPFVCDVRHAGRLSAMFRHMDYCLHTAALKHVGSSERSPFETVQTNILGVEHVIRAALDNNLERVLLTSSDKAVNPTNVMGTTKLMGERLVTAANAMLGLGSASVFASVRFGNVAGSAGSAVPLFCEQIAKGGPVTLTDPKMTRFVMTLSEAVRLVLKSLRLAQGGEVFVTRMPVVRIEDLIEELILLVAPLWGHMPAAIEVRVTGPRPGEKLCEELTTEEELRRTLDLGELYAVLPAFRNIYDRINYRYPDARPAEQVHNSATEAPIGRAQLRQFLLQPGVLPPAVLGRLAADPPPPAVASPARDHVLPLAIGQPLEVPPQAHFAAGGDG